MADMYKMDSHKLMYHPERVIQWLKGDNIYPLCIEISPSGCCNHRCVFCGLDYLGYKKVFLDRELILDNLNEMHEKGLKSLVVCGEGEPLLNPDTPAIIKGAALTGLDVALATNGVLFNEEISKETLPHLKWVRFSLNAGTSINYSDIHGTKPDDFTKVLHNIKSAVIIKKQENLSVTIGVQFILLPQNESDVILLAEILKDIGVDYFSIKPYSKHPKSGKSIDPDYKNHEELEKRLETLNTNSFNVIFRSSSMKKKKKPKSYDKCLGIPFWAYIDSNAEVWSCISYIGVDGFSYGNLKEKSFVNIWESAHKKEVANRITCMDITDCRELCRLDEINGYLQRIKEPFSHDNFI